MSDAFRRFMLARRDLFFWNVLAHYRWFRALIGGHWEQWYVDVIYSEEWFSVDGCRKGSDDRPCSICRGTPLCEDWPAP